MKPKLPGQGFPLQRIVLNVTNQCNLACTYCYEYSEDKITKTDGKPKFMTRAVAESAIDMLILESGDRPSIHVTFFGGETLMNFQLLRTTVEYTKEKCAGVGKQVEFSLTTNATLLTEQTIDFLAEHKIGVTISIDGNRELNDKMRVFADGRGSYDVIVPRIRCSSAAQDKLHRRSRHAQRRRVGRARDLRTPHTRGWLLRCRFFARYRQPEAPLLYRRSKNGKRTGRIRRPRLGVP